jgi:hypothetical protein
MPKVSFKDHDADSLRKIATELRRYASSLEVFAREFEEDNFSLIQIGNASHLERGLTGISKFINAVREAHHEAAIKFGMFARK